MIVQSGLNHELLTGRKPIFPPGSNFYDLSTELVPDDNGVVLYSPGNPFMFLPLNG
jgi:hypothetical protein